MESDDELLDEVVVIGYGQQRKVTLTGSVSNVGGKELLKSPAASRLAIPFRVSFRDSVGAVYRRSRCRRPCYPASVVSVRSTAPNLL